MLKGHGGNRIELARQLGCLPQEIIDMSSNINPLGPPPGLIDYLREHIDAVGRFPEVDSREIAEQFADQSRIDADRVLAGNGTTQFIYALPQALGMKSALIVGPTYSDYADACRLNNVNITFVTAAESRNFQPELNQISKHLGAVDSVFICNPNNLKVLCRAYPDTIFVVDESYLSFIQDAEENSIRREELSNLIVLVSISKIFAIPGLRIGFVVSSGERMQQMRRFLQPWSVNSLAQLATGYLMVKKNEMDTFIRETSRLITAERERFITAFEDVPDIILYPTTTNFLVAGLQNGLNADVVCRRLTEHKIMVRNCRNFFGLTNRHIRISLKLPEHNLMLTQNLFHIAQQCGSLRPEAEKRLGIAG